MRLCSRSRDRDAAQLFAISPAERRLAGREEAPPAAEAANSEASAGLFVWVETSGRKIQEGSRRGRPGRYVASIAQAAWGGGAAAREE